MVFQKPNPFPKSIFDNVAYGPAHQRPDARDLDDIVEHALRAAALWDEVKDKLKQSRRSRSRAASSSGSASRARSRSSPT